MRASPSGSGAGPQPAGGRRGLGGRLARFGVALLGVVLPVVARPTTAHAQRGCNAVGPPDRAVVSYQPPVNAAITDPFRPPLTPYGPGNRGIDYATVPGTLVHAAADGLVQFAGAVAGGLHVTVLHRDGVRTTY